MITPTSDASKIWRQTASQTTPTIPTPDEICEELAVIAARPDTSPLNRDMVLDAKATIERLSAALEKAIEAIQTERDCLVECATMPPDHDLFTLDPDTKPHVEEYDAMLVYLRAVLKAQETGE